jgi:hypothetical protein
MSGVSERVELMLDLGSPRCPSCDHPLLVMWVRGRRHMYCECDESQGEPSPAGAPTCNLCPTTMKRRLGRFGRWQGRWFWFCPTHVVANATVEAPPGPADPRTLHHKEPAMGGGFAKRGM